jgi:hypothetical protein
MRSVLLYVLPCSGAKLDQAAPARQLYTGSMFGRALPIIEAAAAAASDTLGQHTEVRVLSARHGLIALEAVIEPYDQRMDALTRSERASLATVVAGQLVELASGRDAIEIRAFLPRAYLRLLTEATDRIDLDAQVADAYQRCRGVGDQRHVLATLRHNH